MYEIVNIERMYTMNLKMKKVSLIILITTIIAVLLGYIVSYANDGTLYVNLQETDDNKVGYFNGSYQDNKSYSGYIWNIKTYNSNNINDVSAKQRNLYCIKADYSTTWNKDGDLNAPHNIVQYNLSYDFQKDRDKLIRLLGNGNDAN